MSKADASRTLLPVWQDYVVGAFTVTQATVANLAEAFVVEGATSLGDAAVSHLANYRNRLNLKR